MGLDGARSWSIMVADCGLLVRGTETDQLESGCPTSVRWRSEETRTLNRGVCRSPALTLDHSARGPAGRMSSWLDLPARQRRERSRLLACGGVCQFNSRTAKRATPLLTLGGRRNRIPWGVLCFICGGGQSDRARRVQGIPVERTPSVIALGAADIQGCIRW